MACLNSINYLEHNDWRLPNRKELRSLVDYSQANPPISSGNPFINVKTIPNTVYWSSTTSAYNTNSAWAVYMRDGRQQDYNKSDISFYTFYVWPVRTGLCTDTDGDGYNLEGGNCGLVDCDDKNAGINPSAVEICDGKDNNCNNSTDEDFDTDGDGYSACRGDCNDNNAAVNPGATEVCDGKDNDCDGSIDDGLADLYISSMSASISANSGDTISVSDTTNKSGSCSAIASTTKIYFSKDNKYSSGDTELGSRAVPAFGAGAQSSSGSTSVTIPTNACTQTYYLIARADANGNVSEWNEGNNNRAIAIGITNPTPPTDLYVSSITTPSSANAGDTISVSDTTNKSGQCAIGASTTKIYLSADNKYSASDTYLGSRSVPGFGAGAGNNSGSTNVTIPSGTPVGSYYIIVRADGGGAIAEWNEGNNNRAGVITINP